MASDETKQKVSDDAMSGNNGGVNSTPTFFLNGEKVTVRDYTEFTNLLKNLK